MFDTPAWCPGTHSIEWRFRIPLLSPKFLSVITTTSLVERGRSCFSVQIQKPLKRTFSPNFWLLNILHSGGDGLGSHNLLIITNWVA